MSRTTILDLFKKEGVKLPYSLKWIPGGYRFERVDLGSVPTVPGVYALVFNNKIYKIGKAEGNLGLKQRLNTYFSKLPKDSTHQFLARGMESELVGAELDVYYISSHVKKFIDSYGVVGEKIYFILDGKKFSHSVHKYEKYLSEAARDQEEPMSLSKDYSYLKLKVA